MGGLCGCVVQPGRLRRCARPGMTEGHHPVWVAALGRALDGPKGSAQLNESPHAHDPVAFGLSMVKPCFSIVSTKSMEAPST